MNEREARNHPRRNVLNQSLGAGHQFMEPHLGSVSYEPGDRFLICSDGLTDGIWSHRLADMVREPDLMAKRLVEFSVNESGRDNTTALVIEIT